MDYVIVNKIAKGYFMDTCIHKIDHENNPLMYIKMAFLTTRFTDETLRENMRFRATHKVACIYNLMVPIAEHHPFRNLYVLEMNNTKDELVGIGVITKKRWPKEQVYENPYYNRYTYKGDLYFPSSELPPQFVKELEDRLFRGKGHLKRGKSMTQFPDKWLKKEYYDMMFDVQMKRTDVTSLPVASLPVASLDACLPDGLKT